MVSIVLYILSIIDKTNEVTSDGALDQATQVSRNVDTPAFNKKTGKAVDGAPTTPETVIADLKEKVTQLESELPFIIGENDDI